MTQWEERYQVVELDEIMAYFIEGFTLPEGTQLRRYHWYLDQSKGKVVFALILSPLEADDGT